MNMKSLRKPLLVIVALALLAPADAQFLNRLVRSAGNTAENAVQSNVNRQIDRAIDDAFEGNHNERNNSKKDKRQQDEEQTTVYEQQTQQSSQSVSSSSSASQGWTCPACGTQGNTGKFCNECGTKRPEQQSNVWTCPACGHEGNTGKFCDECGTKRDGTKQAERAASEWNKFDFVPGDEVIFYDQLENEQLGEFPSKWELIEGEAEIQKLNGENVIALMNDVRIMPLIEPMWNYLPDVYTIEFDYYEVLQKHGEYYGAIEFLVMPENEHNLYYELWNVNFENFISESSHSYYNDDSKTIYTHFDNQAITTGQPLNNENKIPTVEFNKWHHISISVNKRAVKIYYDETRVLNVPNYKNPNGGYFGFHYSSAETQYPLYIKNVRFAKGAKPLYDRMMTDGKFITYGITFDVGKAVIKPESMGEINRIVKLMTDDPSLKFEVQGHTDNTGNAASNQTLSEQRAQAIVSKLVEMGISADRLTAVGKGQTNPIADNSTDEGRAKNRRVEFIKK